MFQAEDYKLTDNNLQWLVKECVTLRYNDKKVVTEKFVPRPDVGLVFHFKDLPSVIIGNDLVQFQPYIIASILKKFLSFQFSGNLDSLIIVCKPAVLSRIFNLNLAAAPESQMNLLNNKLKLLWENLSAQQNTESRIKYFSEYIQTIQKEPYIPDEIDALYNEILDKGVHSPLKEMLQSCCSQSMSERTLYRKFLKRTGVSYKTLTRIVRFQYLWDKVENERVTDYQDLIFYGNYFDQMHFIKDFKLITGETPHYFFHRNLEVLHKLSGKFSRLS